MGQPSNINYLSQLGYRLIIHRLPEVEYFLQRVNIPGINVGAANRPTPFASPIPYSGDITYNDLTFSFKLDADLKGYLSIWEWMVALGFPEKFDQYRELATTNEPLSAFEEGMVASNIKLMLLNNKHNPIYEIDFYSCWPTALSDLTLTSTDTNVDYLTAEVTFKYSYYTISKSKTSSF
jgi:hypothetical protein